MSVDAAHLWTLNHRLLTGVLDACQPQMRELGLDAKEFFVLAEVERSPYPAQLATELVIPKASVTVYVRNLTSQGYLRREIDDTDLRRHRLTLTPEGVAARDAAVAALAREFQRRLDRVSPADRDHLERTLTAMIASDTKETPDAAD